MVPDEKPVIFGVELERIDNAMIERRYKISPLQIDEIDPEKSEVVHITYTGKR